MAAAAATPADENSPQGYFHLSDNYAHVTIQALNKEAAILHINLVLSRFCALVAAMLVNAHLTYIIVQADQDGVPIDIPRPQMWGRLHRYHLDQMKSVLTASSGLLDGWIGDQRLDQGLRYFSLGGSLCEIMQDSVIMGQVLDPICFLQFWKAIATIAGDPSSESDHQSRCLTYGFGKDYFRDTLKPLHDMRNKFDVAHIASLSDPAIVSRQDVDRCRAAASELIVAYAKTQHLTQKVGGQ